MIEERYARNLGPLSEAECRLLAEKTVFVAGLGGLGGYVAELLARVGVGTLRLADGDVFEKSNLNRQLLCEEGLVGVSKAAAAKERLRRVNSAVLAEAVEAFVTEDNADALLADCQLAVDALDSVPARRILAAACARMGVPLIHGAVNGWCAQVTRIPPGGKAFDLLYPRGAAVPASGYLSFTPALAAAIESAEAVKALLGRQPSLDGRLLTVDLLTQQYTLVDWK